MGKTLVLGTLLGLAYGAAETLFAQLEGEGIASSQLAAHVFLGASATLVVGLLLQPWRGLRPRAASLAAGATAVGVGALVYFFRAYLGGLRADPWGAPSHLRALAVGLAISLGAIGILWLSVRLLPRSARALGWSESKGVRVLCAALVLLAALRALPILTGIRAPRLGQEGTASALPYNVAVFTIDTLRQDHLSQYGYARDTSRSLDRFGFTRFDHVVATANWTKPATASLLTGTYPSQHQASFDESMLPRSALTLTEILAAEGAVTAFCTANINASGLFGMDQGAHYTTGDPRRPTHPLAGTTIGEVLRQGVFSLREAQNLNRHAEAFLERARGRRFFLYVHYNDVHTPYDPPPDYLALFDAPFEGRVIVRPNVEMPISRPERRHMLARYDGEIRDVTDRIVELLDRMERSGVLEETIVVVTSDHGESFGEHGFWAHGNSGFETLIRIPLLIRLPRDFPRVESVALPCSQIDVLPTLLDYLGVEHDAAPARSLRPALELQPLPADRILISGSLWTPVESYLRGGLKVIRDGRQGRPPLLGFDLEVDRQERTDLADSREHADALDALVRAGREEQQALSDASSLEPEDREITPGLLDELRRLGYVE